MRSNMIASNPLVLLCVALMLPLSGCASSKWGNPQWVDSFHYTLVFKVKGAEQKGWSSAHFSFHEKPGNIVVNLYDARSKALLETRVLTTQNQDKDVVWFNGLKDSNNVLVDYNGMQASFKVKGKSELPKFLGKRPGAWGGGHQ